MKTNQEYSKENKAIRKENLKLDLENKRLSSENVALLNKVKEQDETIRRLTKELFELQVAFKSKQ